MSFCRDFFPVRQCLQMFSPLQTILGSWLPMFLGLTNSWNRYYVNAAMYCGCSETFCASCPISATGPFLSDQLETVLLFLLTDRTRPHPIQRNAVLQGIAGQEAACDWIHCPRAAQQRGWILDRCHVLPGQEACGRAGFPRWAAPPCSRRLRSDCISSPSLLFLSFPSWPHPNVGVLNFLFKAVLAVRILPPPQHMCEHVLPQAPINPGSHRGSSDDGLCIKRSPSLVWRTRCFSFASEQPPPLLCRTGRLKIAFFRFVSVDAKEQQQKARGQRRTHLTPLHFLFLDKSWRRFVISKGRFEMHFAKSSCLQDISVIKAILLMHFHSRFKIVLYMVYHFLYSVLFVENSTVGLYELAFTFCNASCCANTSGLRRFFNFVDHLFWTCFRVLWFSRLRWIGLIDSTVICGNFCKLCPVVFFSWITISSILDDNTCITKFYDAGIN